MDIDDGLNQTRTNVIDFIPTKSAHTTTLSIFLQFLFFIQILGVPSNAFREPVILFLLHRILQAYVLARLTAAKICRTFFYHSLI